MFNWNEPVIASIFFASGVLMGIWAMTTRFKNKTRFNDGRRKRVRNKKYRLN